MEKIDGNRESGFGIRDSGFGKRGTLIFDGSAESYLYLATPFERKNLLKVMRH
jgi:hypothetical protein